MTISTKSILFVFRKRIVFNEECKTVTKQFIELAELLNIPDWEWPDVPKAPFYEGLERNEQSVSHSVPMGVGFLVKAGLRLCYWNAHSLQHSKNWL